MRRPAAPGTTRGPGEPDKRLYRLKYFFDSGRCLTKGPRGPRLPDVRSQHLSPDAATPPRFACQFRRGPARADRAGATFCRHVHADRSASSQAQKSSRLITYFRLARPTKVTRPCGGVETRKALFGGNVPSCAVFKTNEKLSVCIQNDLRIPFVHHLFKVLATHWIRPMAKESKAGKMA